jgi:hypothetical protein
VSSQLGSRAARKTHNGQGSHQEDKPHQCFARLELNNGDQVMISVAQGEVKVVREANASALTKFENASRSSSLLISSRLPKQECPPPALNTSLSHRHRNIPGRPQGYYAAGREFFSSGLKIEEVGEL